MKLISPALCRAGRSLLEWSQAKLAEKSGVNSRTLNDYERNVGSPRESTEAKLQLALEDEGVIFMAIGDIRGVGVREP